MTAPKSGEIISVDSDSILPIERRQHERITVYLRARWEGLLGCYEGTLSDISAGGCFIMSDDIPAAKELLRLEIELHSGEWVKVWGEVTNRFEGIGFGIRYTEIVEEFEPGKYDKAIGHAKALKSAVAALKKFDASVIKRNADESVSILVSLSEYNYLLMLTLPRVNKDIATLSECRKKTSIRLSVESYVDAGRAWAVMSKGAQSASNQFTAMAALLKDRYVAPPEIIQAFVRGDHLLVLNHLWVRSYIYLAFAI
jgi:hypothetical protein